ncbi:post-transcriptional regulator [Bacillaceae bacterium Marseille-Q3522]|nr:post-transcriptional regulator [Bacillaceae bacterium Marseille-Q3522]
MAQEHPYDSFKLKIKPVLQSKLEEFALLGYGTVQEEELWTFLTKKVWKTVKEDIKLFEIIEAVFAVKISDVLNYISIEAYKTAEFDFDSEEERNFLLN